MNTRIFDSGQDPATYVASLRNYRSFVRSIMGEPEIETGHVEALAASVKTAQQPVRATLMTEDWCGDSACNLPALASLFDAARVELRIVRGSEEPDLHAFYRDQGVDHIPVLSVWDGLFNELGRWIEAPAGVAAKKDAWKAARPEFMDVFRRKNEDKDAAKQWAVLYREFMNAMLEWYRDGMWNETAREIVAALS